MDEFTKVVTKTEAKYRYWQIRKADRSFFPEEFEPFKIKFLGKIFEIKVNNRDCIMTGLFHYDYTFMDGDVVKIMKNKNGTYEMSIEGKN